MGDRTAQLCEDRHLLIQNFIESKSALLLSTSLGVIAFLGMHLDSGHSASHTTSPSRFDPACMTLK